MSKYVLHCLIRTEELMISSSNSVE